MFYHLQCANTVSDPNWKMNKGNFCYSMAFPASADSEMLAGHGARNEANDEGIHTELVKHASKEDYQASAML